MRSCVHLTILSLDLFQNVFAIKIKTFRRKVVKKQTSYHKYFISLEISYIKIKLNEFHYSYSVNIKEK